MTFARVNAPGWSVGAKLTSAQQNQLDIDHANALDKTGDTIPNTSVISLAGTMNISGGGGITVNSTGGVNSLVSGGVTASVAQGVLSIAAGGISSNVIAGISPTVAAGITDGSVVGGISTTIAGGLALGGGPVDWPAFSSRSITVCCPPLPMGPATGWTATQGCIVGPATATAIYLAMPRLWPGCTITNIAAIVKVPGPHSSVPADLPKISVYSFSWSAGGSPMQVFLRSPNSVTFGDAGSGSAYPGSPSAWDALGNLQSWNYVCNQNNTAIDTTHTGFYITLTDENGSGAVSGNEYFGFEVTMTATSLALF